MTAERPAAIKRVFAGAATALALLVAPDAIAQEDARQIVERWIADGDALDGITVTHGGVAHDPATGVTTVRDLVFAFETSPFESGGSNPQAKDAQDGAAASGPEAPVTLSASQTVTFPAIRFENLSFQDGYYKAFAISADAAELKSVVEGSAQAASRTDVTYKALRVENPRWAGLPKIVVAPGKPVSSYYPLVAALVDFSFDGVRIDGVEAHATGGQPGSEFTLSYGAISAGEAVRGDISAMTIDGMTMKVKSETVAEDGQTVPVDVEIISGPVTASRYNYGTMVRAFDPAAPASDADTPFATAIGGFEIPSVVVKGDGFKGTMGRLWMADFGVRPPKAPLLAELDRLAIAYPDGAQPPEDEIATFMSNAFSAFRLGSIGIANVVADMPEAGFSGRLGSYEIRDLSSNGIGAYEMAAIDSTGPDGIAVHIGRIAVKDVGFPEMKALMNIEDAEKAGDVQAILAAIPTWGELSYDDVSAKVPGIADFALGKAAFTMSGHIGPIPTRMAIDIRNAAFPVAQLPPQSREPLEGMGYERVDASAKLTLAWDEKSQQMSMVLGASLVDGGELEARADLGGLPRFMFENPQTGFPAAVVSMNLIGGAARFTDASILERGFALAAKGQGADPATLKQQVVGLIPFMLAPLNRPDFVELVSGAAKGLVDGSKKTVHVTVTPKAPVYFIQMAGAAQTDPALLFDMLKISVTAE